MHPVDGTLWLTERPKPKDLKKVQRITIRQRKYDGRRLTIVRKTDGTMNAWSRELYDDVDYWPKIEAVLLELTMPEGSAIDGELFVKGAPASDVLTALNEQHEDLTFMPFAVPFWSGRDHRTETAQVGDAILRHVCNYTGLEKPETHECRYLTAENFEEECQRFLDEATKRRIEGWVFKAWNYKDWYRLKPVKTVDCIVTGWKEGTGKYKGKMGALHVSVYLFGELVEIATVGGGWNDRDRASITSTSHIGKVMELTYDSVQKDRLRFPRFSQWRDDKPAEQCTKDQLK